MAHSRRSPGRRLLTMVFAALAAMSLLAGCAAPTQPAAGPAVAASKLERTSLKVATSVLDLGFLPLYVADTKGFWKDEGLKVEMIPMRGGRQATQAIIGGAVDVMASAWTEPLTFLVAEQDLKSFWSISNYPAYKWYAKPGVNSMNDLKGKKVKAAISGIGALSHIVMQWGLKQVGFADAMVDYVPVGSATERVAALRTGQVDIITANPPGSYILEASGLKPVIEMEKHLDQFAYETYYAPGGFIDRNPETIKALIRGTIRGIHYMRANPEEAAKILIERLAPRDQDQGHALPAVRWAMDGFPVDGAVADRGVQVMVDFFIAQGKVKPGTTYRDITDMRYIEFFKQNPYTPR